MNNKETISTNKITDKINKRLNLNLKDNFFEIFLKHLSECAPNELNKEISSTLEYLSKKYILYGLKTDIAAGVNLKFDSCWYNYKNKINNLSVKPTYEIKNFDELKDIL